MALGEDTESIVYRLNPVSEGKSAPHSAALQHRSTVKFDGPWISRVEPCSDIVQLLRDPVTLPLEHRKATQDKVALGSVVNRASLVDVK